MTFMDAIQLGVKTIMVPQGFQHDLKDLITFKVDKNLRNLDKILLEILDSKIIFKKYKDILTWDNYVEKHLDIWKKFKNLKIKTSFSLYVSITSLNQLEHLFFFVLAIF